MKRYSITFYFAEIYYDSSEITTSLKNTVAKQTWAILSGNSGTPSKIQVNLLK